MGLRSTELMKRQSVGKPLLESIHAHVTTSIGLNVLLEAQLT